MRRVLVSTVVALLACVVAASHPHAQGGRVLGSPASRVNTLPGGLKFGTATSDRVTVPTSASLIDKATWTWITVLQLDSTTTQIRPMQMGLAATGGFRLIFVTDASGNITINVNRATTATNYVTNSAPLAKLGRPILLAVSFDFNAAQLVHAYSAFYDSPGATLTEATWGTTTAGSGTMTAMGASEPLYIGNSGLLTRAWIGPIWFSLQSNDVLTQAEIAPFLGDLNAPAHGVVGRWFIGQNGSAGPVVDWSGYGNHGTTTGLVPFALPIFAPMSRAS